MKKKKPEQLGLFTPKTPISDETGGALNAIEAGRITMRKSIQFVGKISTNGVVACRDHVRGVVGVFPGFWITVFLGGDASVGKCVTCGCDVIGETP